MSPGLEDREVRRTSYRGYVLIEMETPRTTTEEIRGVSPYRLSVRIFRVGPGGGLRRVGDAPFIELARKEVDKLLQGGKKRR